VKQTDAQTSLNKKDKTQRNEKKTKSKLNGIKLEMVYGERCLQISFEVRNTDDRMVSICALGSR